MQPPQFMQSQIQPPMPKIQGISCCNSFLGHLPESIYGDYHLPRRHFHLGTDLKVIRSFLNVELSVYPPVTLYQVEW